MTTATRQTPDATELVPAIEDSREIRCQQGKPCVYEPDHEPGIIVTEWPNGVVDRDSLETKTRTGRWPDGTIETVPADTPLTFPDWPSQEASPQRGEDTDSKRMAKLTIVIGSPRLPPHGHNAVGRCCSVFRRTFALS